MSLELYKKIIDDLSQIRSIREICLSGFGEPFLDKEMIPKIKYAKEKTNKNLILFSNFSAVNPSNFDEIITSGLDVLNISFNGSSKESYEGVMKLNFDQVSKNVEQFLLRRKELRSDKPLVYMSCILNNYNETEVTSLKKKWGHLVDGIYIAPPDNWVGGVKVDLSKYKHLNQRKKHIYPCKLFYPIINWNGEVGFCCRDYEGKEIFGDLNHQNFMEIWNSSRYKLFREEHYSGKMRSVCAVCDVPYKQNGIKWWEPL